MISFKRGSSFPIRWYIYRNGLELICPFNNMDVSSAICGDWCPLCEIHGEPPYKAHLSCGRCLIILENTERTKALNGEK